MKKLFNVLFSFYLMGAILLTFAISIAVATFIENDFGTSTARAVVYNAWWFNMLLFIGIVNLSGIILVHKLYRKEKFSLFLFHISFIIILIGSAITRFLGYEGTMHIRQGETSDLIVINGTYLTAKTIDNNDTIEVSDKILISGLSKNYVKVELNSPKNKIQVECLDIIANAMPVSKESANGKPLLDLVVASMNGRENIPVLSGESKKIGMYEIAFNDTSFANKINVWLTDSGFYIKSPVNIVSVSMTGQSSDTLEANKIHPFKIKSLYSIGGIQLVAKNFLASGEIEYVTMPHAENGSFPTVFKLKITVNNQSKIINYFAFTDNLNQTVQVKVNNIPILLQVGAKPLNIPFSLKLNKFIVKHYPGSNSPSWFESQITLIDPIEKTSEEKRIFMNNVLKYKGFRFFQSSYDKDEEGTILSVNHDYWGTLVTYLGYLLMGIGMFLALFNKKSRFHKLSEELKIIKERKKALSVLLVASILVLGNNTKLNAQHTHDHMGMLNLNPVDISKDNVPDSMRINKKIVDKFGSLLIQDLGGRIKPLNSLSSELIRKISRKTNIMGLNTDEVILSMLTYPAYWQTVPMIRFSHPEIAKILNVEGKYVSFQGLFDPVNPGKYVLSDYVSEAYRKNPGKRSKLESELIRLDERANLCYLIYTGDFFKIYPKEGDANQTWYNPENAASVFHGDDSLFVSNAFEMFLEYLRSKPSQENLNKTEEIIDALHNFQNKYGGEIIPSASKTKIEIIYNKSNVFERIASIYGIVGFILLILQFIGIFKVNMQLTKTRFVFKILIIIAFAFHLMGLAIRWYIGGHAPWSNGYESMIYIAFATIIAGIIFSKKTPIALSATALLAWIILDVAHLSWMDPEITNIVPVLNSYWLVIHVAVITASYGFLALGALMAFLNLIFMFVQSDKNFKRIDLTISELTSVIEMTLIVGLYMLTIGTFLGGVWANESWGRYWGWDPKETWALVSVLVYAFVAHIRLIPGLKNRFLFNLFALLSFSCVIMTYFGVNYYLSGLHSYAKGDSIPVPAFVYYTITIIGIVALLAFVNQRLITKRRAD